MVALDAESDKKVLKLPHWPVAMHIVSTAFMICLIPAAALWTSIEVNRYALSSSREIVQDTVGYLRASAFTFVRDFSIWNEAFNAVIRDDRTWLYSNIAVGVTSLGIYDLLLFVVPDRPEFGWTAVSPDNGETGLLPPDMLTAVLALIDENVPPTPDTRTLFAEFLGEPWLFAISPMTPVTGAPPGTTLDLLPLQIHGYQLTDKRLQLGGLEPRVEGIRIADDVAPREPTLPLVGFDGSIVTNLTWDSPRPGTSILRAAALPLALAVGAAIILSGIISCSTVRLRRRLRTALDAAQAADRSKTEFLVVASQRLKTPTTGVSDAIRLLQASELDSRQKALVSEIKSFANAQLPLIDGLAARSRAKAGTLPPNSLPFEPAGVASPQTTGATETAAPLRDTDYLPALDEIAALVLATREQLWPARSKTFWQRVQSKVKAAEPWGVLFAVLALLATIVIFWVERTDREEDRINRAIGQFAEGFGRVDALSVLLRNDVDLRALKAPEAYLPNADLASAILHSADFARADLTRANLNGANLFRADLSAADLAGADLTGADLRRANLHEADLIGASLSGARLNQTDFTSADLAGADLVGAQLTGANLTGADLTRADLTRANLFRADLTATKLCGTIMPDQTVCNRDCGSVRSQRCTWFRGEEAFGSDR